ncbi:MAG: IS630 family transposase, partial [Cyanobacteria bacterium P01_F01_bin.53]
RLWKFVRNQCLYSKYYADFDDLKEAIETCIEQANTIHKASLETLLTLNFQSFRKVQISGI